ncbi:hypothetical protein BJX66DRAFT_320732 [Aspergillus keveii]|uniref:Uncharacterized protein n=1 Tax=Aspergillus keveii TaxID=714993 RepID=A0ABR4FGR9_9EURO
MATDTDISTVERVIGYRFKRRSLICQALTAAGAEEDNYDGNRKLSQIGASHVDVLLGVMLFDTGVGRAGTAEMPKVFLDKKHYSTAAKQTGIDQCIKRNVRTASDCAKVHRLVINAIIAAVLLDSSSFRTTLVVTLRIFMAKSEKLWLPSVDPHLRNSFLDVSESLMALETGTVNPATLVGETASYYPTVHSLFDRSTSVPPISNAISNALVSRMTPDSKLFEQFINLDLDIEAPLSISPSPPTPALHILEKGSEDTLTAEARNGHRTNDPSAPRDKGREPASRPSAKPRKTRNICTKIDEFLAQEAAKCKVSGVLPEITYFNDDIRDAMSKFDKSVTLLFLTIAAPQQIARLREIIRSARDEKLLCTYALTDEISPTVRFQMILDLDQKSTTAQLVRRYHIVALFKACGGDAVRSITGFVNTTSDNFLQQERSFGNPANIEYANVASVMMREIYPDLEVGQLGYEAKLKRIKKLRKLGKRLHILTEKFGRGLLGLMISLGMDDNCVEGAQPDDVILGLDDARFGEFIRLLDSSQGSLLRDFSIAVSPPIMAMLQGRLEAEEPFPLERVGADQILLSTKGSPDLLQLIQ